ncbi:MAG TPA: 7-carboxy-7-deazaguanine synthase QueE [Gemmatimonadaceae bacterium]|nr:7-carboxy-7-deazaguanine synthase QueE [Gemmatimonadaceae bacterium]
MSVTFRVNDIYATIQGEGNMVGTPMILLRLHGCSVGCTFCDTKETWATGDAALPWRRATLEEARGSNEFWAELDEDSLVRAVCDERDGKAPGVEWVLLTGGEPAEQPIQPLVRALHRAGFRVALETSGTARGHLSDGSSERFEASDGSSPLPHREAGHESPGDSCDFVCCSPKIGNPGGRPILADVVRGADEIKMVIGRTSDIERFEAFIREHGLTDMSKLSLQPMSESRKATELCMAAALRLGCRVSIQTHKVIGVR